MALDSKRLDNNVGLPNGNGIAAGGAEEARSAQDRSADHLNNRIFFRLFQVGNTLQKQSVKELGITTVQWAVLGALTDPLAKDGIALGELAEFLVVSRQNLNGVLKRLVRDGFVGQITDVNDRRARVVRISPAGLAFWASLQARIYLFYDQATGMFNMNDRLALGHYLNGLQQQLVQVHLDAKGKALKEKAHAGQSGEQQGRRL
ncbi:MAG: MarR-family transcriptional regulator [Bradyrhizobium sp.]|nr:MarR-family transcriptional regulator [Bradyrhizobium sp.]